MKYKLLTAIVSILCVLMMMAMTFQPAAACHGSGGTAMHPDIWMDGEGNIHMVYAQMVRDSSHGWQTDIFYQNNIGMQGHGHHQRWNPPVQISDSETDSVWPQVSVDSSTGIIYVSWIEESFRDNKFWYAGCDNDGVNFTQPRYGTAAPWPVAPNQNMVASNGVLTFTWRPRGSLSLVADIDGDLIPDIDDPEPMVYNTDNFAIEITPDVVATDNELGVTIAIDYGGQDDAVPTISPATGDFAVSTGDYIEINLDTATEFSAIIKMPIPKEVPQNLRKECLRMYRQVGDDWVAVTDWELGEFTGISTEHGYVWAYVKHFSTYTTADASQVDGDGDGLTDLTEDTEPSSGTQISLSANNFYRRSVNTLPDVASPVIPPNAIYITNVVELQNMANNLNGYYVLANDIDASETSTWNGGAGFVPVGADVNRFTGSLDGRGHVIANLYINRPTTDYVGLFGFVGNGGAVENVGLMDNIIIGQYYVGGLVGYIFLGSVSNSYATGRATGNHVVGGLVGYNYDGSVSNSCATGGASGGNYAGGLVGTNDGSVSNSYATGYITGTQFVGGLVGYNYDGSVSNSYAMANIAGTNYVGGLVGYADSAGSLVNTYSVGVVSGGSYCGGLVGGNTGTITSSYYDSTVSGRSDTGRGEPSTTAQMKQQARFVDWDILNIWWMIEDVTYPRFQWSYPDMSVAHLFFEIEPFNVYLAVTGYLEISSTSAGPIENLELDIGNDGKIDWRAPVDFDGALRFGTIRHAISDYMFKNYINTDAKMAEIPFKFSSTTPGEIYINHARIIVEDITTDNGMIDTNGDGLVDGWFDQNGNFIYERPGNDGTLGDSDDEIPGALVHNLDPREINVIGSSGRVAWNEFQEGINQVNGNLALSSVDLQFKALGHNLAIDRTYNSLNSGIAGPFGYGWDFNYGEKLEQLTYFVEFTAGDGSSYLFEDLEDGTYSSPAGSNIDMRFTETNYMLRYTDGTVKQFSTDGKLEKITDKNGNALLMTYDIDGKLTRVEDDTGLFLNFVYTGDHITGISDPLGRTISYTYQDSRLVSMIDAKDYEYRYEYDSTLGKLSTTINPLGMYKEYQYSAEFPHKVTRCTVGEYDFGTSQKTPIYIDYDAVYAYPSHTSALDANGANSTRIFDKNGVAIEVRNPDGTVVEKNYDNDLNLVKETDALGKDWENDYDPLGNQVGQKDPTGNASANEFENIVTGDEYISLPTKTVDKNGAETTYAYDANRNPSAMTDQNDETTEFVFTSNGLLERQTRPNGAATSYTYDIFGNTLTETDALDKTVSYTYDDLNRKVTMTDARGGVTQYFYDNLDRITMVIDPLLNEEEYTYDAMGNTLTVKSRTGAITTYDYDVFGRKISETDALGNTAHFYYDWKGNLIEEVDKRGASTFYEYDTMDRLVKMTDHLGNFEWYVYDDNGNQLERIDKLDNTWWKEYDALGRVTDEFCPYGFAIQYEYDAEGRMTKKIDRLGYETIYEYDARGSQTRVLGAEGSDTRYEYDAVGNLISVSQIGEFDNSIWQYGYDLLGRKISETTPLGFTYFWEYDEAGNLIEYIDANDENTSYKYDALNRLTNLALPGTNLQEDYQINITYYVTEKEREEYDYPPIMVTYGSSMMPFPPRMYAMEKEYDLLGRLVREMWAVTDIEGSQVGGTSFYNITYQYDANGNVISMTDQFDLVTTYVYDELNRLVSLTDPDLHTTTYQYDAIGQLVLTTYPIGTRISQRYNAANLLTGIWNIRSDDTVISSFQYAYNLNANRVSMTEADDSVTSYTYDMENRLTSVTYPDATQTQYQYDLKNNLAAITQITGGVEEITYNTYDIENRLLQSGETTYEYDNNGNMIQGDTYYTYQSTFLNGQKVNNLVSVGTVSGGGGGGSSIGEGPITMNSNPPASPSVDTPATSYNFALDGRRVSKAGFVNLTYLYDGENVVYELWDDKVVRFTHPVASGGGCGSGCGAGSCDIFFTDHPISISIDGVKYYYLYDGLGSVTELIDADENVVNFYRYTPFGDALIREEQVYNPYQFTGRQYDAESGLYHYRARAYSPGIGRFMQQDPAEMADGANVYAYVGNDPLNRVDPTGTKSVFYCNWEAMWTIWSWRDKYEISGRGWQLHFAVGMHIARKGCNRDRVKTAMWRIENWEGESGAASTRDVIAGTWGWHYQRSVGHPITIAQVRIPLSGANEIITYGLGYQIMIQNWPPTYIAS